MRVSAFGLSACALAAMMLPPPSASAATTTTFQKTVTLDCTTSFLICRYTFPAVTAGHLVRVSQTSCYIFQPGSLQNNYKISGAIGISPVWDNGAQFWTPSYKQFLNVIRQELPDSHLFVVSQDTPMDVPPGKSIEIFFIPMFTTSGARVQCSVYGKAIAP